MNELEVNLIDKGVHEPQFLWGKFQNCELVDSVTVTSEKRGNMRI